MLKLKVAQWEGYPTFQLAFDLPFYALCLSTTPIKDVPRTASGRRLRRSEDLSFLTQRSTSHRSGEHFYLCEAHVSCVVTGRSNRFWEAYMLADTYSDKWEQFKDYLHDPENPEEVLQDPLRGGRVGDKPILDPRRYFLDVFDLRSKHYKTQWEHLLQWLDPVIRELVGGLRVLSVCRCARVARPHQKQQYTTTSHAS